MNERGFVITIDRQYGSGGRIIGKKLSEELGFRSMTRRFSRWRPRRARWESSFSV